MESSTGYATQPDDQEWQDRDPCQNCGNIDIEKEYAYDLCESCRNELVKHPFPPWLKGFIVLVGALFLYALIQFPSTLKANVHYEKGMNAFNENRHVSAVHHLEKVADRYSDSTKVYAYLFMAYFYNDNIADAYIMLNKIEGRNDDPILVDRVNRLADQMYDWYYYGNDQGFEEILAISDTEEMIDALKHYVQENTHIVTARYLLADKLFDEQRYEESVDELLALKEHANGFTFGRLLLAATYRELGQYGNAEAEAQFAYKLNKESIAANISLSRIAMKQQQYDRALQYAMSAYNSDPTDLSAMGNLALAYHFQANFKERDRWLAKYENEVVPADIFAQQLRAIFEGQTDWLY